MITSIKSYLSDDICLLGVIWKLCGDDIAPNTVRLEYIERDIFQQKEILTKENKLFSIFSQDKVIRNYFLQWGITS